MLSASVSFWSEFETLGQLSQASPTPSPEHLFSMQVLWGQLHCNGGDSQVPHPTCSWIFMAVEFGNLTRKGLQKFWIKMAWPWLLVLDHASAIIFSLSPSESSWRLLGTAGQLSISVGTPSPSGSLSQTSPIPSPSESSWWWVGLSIRCIAGLAWNWSLGINFDENLARVWQFWAIVEKRKRAFGGPLNVRKSVPWRFKLEKEDSEERHCQVFLIKWQLLNNCNLQWTITLPSESSIQQRPSPAIPGGQPAKKNTWYCHINW